MQDKFKFNWNYHSIDQSKLIYAKNNIKKKTLQYLEFYLCIKLITFFASIKDLFNYLKDIFGNFYQKKHAIEKFQDLKIRANLFNNFYFEFI